MRQIERSQRGQCKWPTYRLYNVFEWLAQLGQLGQDVIDNVRCPSVDFVVLVGVAADDSLNGVFDDVRDFIDDERRILTTHHFHRSTNDANDHQNHLSETNKRRKRERKHIAEQGRLRRVFSIVPLSLSVAIDTTK